MDTLVFPKTTEEEDRIANSEAFRIYGELRKKYPNNSVRDFDIILNTLCFAIARMGKLNTLPQDEEKFVSLVVKIISGNIKN